MLELICLVILIAIIWGISLHSAFWGLISFIIGAIIFCSAITLLGNGLDKLLSWSSPPAPTPTPEPEPIKNNQKQVETQKTPTNPIFGWIFYLIITWFFTFFLFAAIGLYDYLNDLPTWLMFALPFLPFVITLSVYLIKRSIAGKKRSKK